MQPVQSCPDSPAVAPGSLLVTGFGRRRRLEAVVLSGTRLDHYRRRLDRPDRPWQRVGTITERADGPGTILRRGGALWVEVAASGSEVGAVYRLAHRSRKDGPGRAGWYRVAGPDVTRWPRPAPDVAVDTTTPGVAVARAGEWALADAGGAVYGYHLVDGEWERDSCLRVDEGHFLIVGPESKKIAQVTGEQDATPTPWGRREPTLSSSLSSAGIVGTDLGVRFEVDGRSLVLFGDTHWAGRPWLGTRDAIGELTADGPRPGLPGVRLHGSPLKLVGAPLLGPGRVTMREYDVPLDGFTHHGSTFIFFTSNHGRNARVMGRCVFTRIEAGPVIDPADRRHPVRCRVLGEFSRLNFINVSVQLRPAAAVPGCSGSGEVLLIWGTGPYRASEVRLALLDQAALERLGRGEPPSGVRYWDGAGWTDDESAAAALFAPAALGELSVRWVPQFDRYLLLAASGPEDPIGPAITLRSAESPHGPWSPRLRLLDWVGTGMARHDPHTRFIKASADGSDPVGDRVFAGQARGTGAAYAPYFFDATTAGDELLLRYTLSTWNPYQVVLMEHRLPLSVFASAGTTG